MRFKQQQVIDKYESNVEKDWGEIYTSISREYGFTWNEIMEMPHELIDIYGYFVDYYARRELFYKQISLGV